MEISKECKITPINWNLIPDLVSKVEKLGFTDVDLNIDLDFFPLRYSKVAPEEAKQLVKEKGEPMRYSITCYAKNNGKKICFSVYRSISIRDEEFLVTSIDGVQDETILDSLMDFLGITIYEFIKCEKPICIDRSVFIAYRFDDIGEKLALKLTRFLELLSFKVSTGRSYSPLKISSKVEKRISNQELFFVILTDGKDDTWLSQEPAFAKAQDKPIFLLKESSYDFNSGIFSDHEFIPFEQNNFEKSFVQILEGLREMKLLSIK